LYIAPGLAVFGDVHHNPWNNFRLYGTVVMLLLTLIVAVGVKFVQMFAPISLACVIISFLSIVIGACLATAESTNIWYPASRLHRCDTIRYDTDISMDNLHNLLSGIGNRKGKRTTVTTCGAIQICSLVLLLRIINKNLFS